MSSLSIAIPLGLALAAAYVRVITGLSDWAERNHSKRIRRARLKARALWAIFEDRAINGRT